MTVLVPMPPDGFAAFSEECIADYASDNALSGRWLATDTLERSRAEFSRLLPHGIATPNHFFFEVRDEALGASVGFVWFAIRAYAGTRSGYVYNIKIRPASRGRGHAKAALDLIAEFSRAQGLAAIALHVFSFNTAAQALYRAAGYGVTGFNMQKLLQSDGV